MFYVLYIFKRIFCIFLVLCNKNNLNKETLKTLIFFNNKVSKEETSIMINIKLSYPMKKLQFKLFLLYKKSNYFIIIFFKNTYIAFIYVLQKLFPKVH